MFLNVFHNFGVAKKHSVEKYKYLVSVVNFDSPLTEDIINERCKRYCLLNKRTHVICSVVVGAGSEAHVSFRVGRVCRKHAVKQDTISLHHNGAW